MKQKITLKQIAKELDVSISTVSKALKDSKEIGEETKKKIQAFAKYYKYRPNPLAVSLKNNSAKIIGVIIPEIVHHFFAEVINGVEKTASENGYTVIIASSNEEFEKEVANISSLSDSLIDGFIISVSKGTLKAKNYAHISNTIELGIPVVLFDRTIDDIVCDKVMVNDRLGAYEGTSELINKGRRKIILITTEDYISIGNERTQGYIQAHKEAQIKCEQDLIIKCQEKGSREKNLFSLEKDLEKSLTLNSDIDGIIAVNESYAAVALKVLGKLNIKVPENVSLICFSDGVISQFSTPPISALSQHGELMGRKAANLLIERLKNPERDYQTEIIECTLIDRNSI